MGLSGAWSWNTHQMFAEKVYNSMPLDLQNKLNLTAMKEGSIAPDRDFHDNIKHHYPPSYDLALKWLDLSCNIDCDYEKASYGFGVATHYITDSFVAPHYIAKEPGYLHSEFENQGKYYISKVKCYDYNLDLKESLIIGSKNYKDWGEWLVSKDENIIFKEIDEAMTVVYSAAFDKFDFECRKETRIENKGSYFNKRNIVIGFIFLIFIILIILFKKSIFVLR